jgi:hypothetical protein
VSTAGRPPAVTVILGPIFLPLRLGVNAATASHCLQVMCPSRPLPVVFPLPVRLLPTARSLFIPQHAQHRGRSPREALLGCKGSTALCPDSPVGNLCTRCPALSLPFTSVAPLGPESCCQHLWHCLSGPKSLMSVQLNGGFSVKNWEECRT